MELIHYLDEKFTCVSKDGSHYVYQTKNPTVQLDVHFGDDFSTVAIMDSESKNQYNEFTIFAVSGLERILGIYGILENEKIKFI